MDGKTLSQPRQGTCGSGETYVSVVLNRLLDRNSVALGVGMSLARCGRDLGLVIVEAI